MKKFAYALSVEPSDVALLVKYLRRATFERTIQHCDGWPMESDATTDQCYEMLRILGSLEGQLDEQRGGRS